MDMMQRYERDPMFHHLVEMLEAMVEQFHTTPTEIREACMLAQIRYESRHLRPVMFTFEELERLGVRISDRERRDIDMPRREP